MLVLAFTSSVFAQQNGSLSGTVQDALGAIVQGASITVVDSSAKEKTAVSNARGEFTVNGLAPGTYTVKVKAANFGLYENTEVVIAAGNKTELIVPLTVEVTEEQVDVSERDSVSTSPENNTSATVLSEKELNALPDDPDELEAALQALAGASAGPNGGQIYIDGFTGGRLPPKEAIREIRINNNPFSAEYDRLGFGRIEILTRPGAEKFRGSVSANFNDESLNSRNPFSDNRAPSQTRFFSGNLSGPIKKGKASYFVDVNKRDVDNNTIVNAIILDSAVNPIAFRQEFQVPSNRFSISPRVDYAINDNNTLVFRYSYDGGSNENQGIGNITLPSRAYETESSGHEFRVTETMIVNAKTVNETRVEFDWDKRTQLGDNSLPAITVSDAFSGGGATIGNSFNRTNTFELQNYTTTSLGKSNEHTLKFGGRVRHASITDRSENGFGGSFSFSGAPAVTSPAGCTPGPTNPSCTIVEAAITPLEQYRQRILGQSTSRFIPVQYSITVGNPEQKVSRTDYGIFVTDDWRISPAVTLSAGLRYENQTNINDNSNFAPRLSVAWAPGAGGARSPLTVFRAGFGVFYERFSENTTLQALRFNGIEQQNYVVSLNESDLVRRAAAQTLLTQPTFTVDGVTNAPTVAQIQAALPSSTIIRQINNDLQSPVTYQGAFSVERQLPRRTTAAISYIFSRTDNVIRMRNINAPICPDTTVSCLNAPIPFPTSGPIYEYESTGRLNQNRINFNIRSNFSTKYSIFGNYSLGFMDSDTDGSFPSYSYDLTDEWGRSSGDVRHSFVVGGNFNAPFGFSLSPFINYNSGRPFNITLGQDLNNDRQFLERPTFGQLAAACTRWSINASYCDVSDYDPNEIIPRNFGRSPQFFSVNLRVGKNFGFGKTEGGSSAGNTGGGAPGQGGMAGIGGPGGGGPRGGGGGGRGGFGGFGGNERKPYNLNLSVDFQNIFNLVNLGSPIGNISSSRFGQSTNISGGFGGFGGFGGGAANRRINLQARFSF